MSNAPLIDAEAEAAILRLAGERGATKTICPSEAARVLCAGDWRGEMQRVHAAAAALAKRGAVALSQRGTERTPGEIDGAYRIATRSPAADA